MIQHTVPSGVPPMPVEKYIRRAWPLVPGHAIQDMLKKRDVRLNGEKISGEALVRGGDDMTLFLADKYLSSEIRTVYEDEHLIVAVKPQGLPVDVDQDGIGADTLLTRLRAKWPAAQLCHRLDAATGGLVMAALDEETHAQALKMFKDHAMRKSYIARVKGGFEKKSGTLRAWLVKDARRATVKVIHQENRNAKPIETRYQVLSDKGGLASVELEPVTGRTHQLRAHMADFGHPILGDDKYGDRGLNAKAPKLALWCASLTVGKNSPMTAYRGRCFTAPRPDWWKFEE